MNDARGSVWRKWDLHVHTPVSVVQLYGGNTDAVWEKFIADIESLPPEFKVIGINDYLFLDGYKKVVDTHGQARGTFTAQASLDLNPGFPATSHI